MQRITTMAGSHGGVDSTASAAGVNNRLLLIRDLHRTASTSRLRVKHGLLIPLAVQYTRHKHALFARPVIDDVAFHGQTAKTRRDLIARPARVRDARPAGQVLERSHG